MLSFNSWIESNLDTISGHKYEYFIIYTKYLVELTDEEKAKIHIEMLDKGYSGMCRIWRIETWDARPISLQGLEFAMEDALEAENWAEVKKIQERIKNKQYIQETVYEPKLTPAMIKKQITEALAAEDWALVKQLQDKLKQTEQTT